MHPQPTIATYRIRKVHTRGVGRRNYRFTYEVSDERDASVMASCHVTGKASLGVLDITDVHGRAWQVTPNRRVLPSRWIVADHTARGIVQFDAKIVGKLINPLYKTALVVLDLRGGEMCRVIDPRTSLPDQLFGVGPGEWAVVNRDQLVAKIVALPAGNERPAGVLQRLSQAFAGSDRGFVSLGAKHLLPAPVVLAMFALHDEITDRS